MWMLMVLDILDTYVHFYLYVLVTKIPDGFNVLVLFWYILKEELEVGEQASKGVGEKKKKSFPTLLHRIRCQLSCSCWNCLIFKVTESLIISSGLLWCYLVQLGLIGCCKKWQKSGLFPQCFNLSSFFCFRSRWVVTRSLTSWSLHVLCTWLVGF